MLLTKSMRACTATVCCLSLLSQTCAQAQGIVPTAPVPVASPVPPLPESATSSVDAPPAMTTLDIELTRDRVLTGQLVNDVGGPIAVAPVEVWRNRQLIQTSMTDQRGRFRLAQLNGGTYKINSGDRVQTARLWTAGSAPPNSISSLRIVADEQVVRAQQRCGAVVGAVNPWVIAGIAVAAVVIPVAIHNNRSDRPASN